MREKLVLVSVSQSYVGITPACAGKTVWLTLVLSLAWDHPRVCGKNRVEITTTNGTAGSPPRVREKQALPGFPNNQFGITPACAGKTVLVFVLSKSIQDHPRVCGKNSNSMRPSPSASGSPPRVREKPVEIFLMLPYFGITPACAGKTSRKRWYR